MHTTANCTETTRGCPSVYTERHPPQTTAHGEAGAIRGLPVRSLLTQTREGFISHKTLGMIVSGKPQGPVKLLSGSAQPLSVGSAAHLKK